MLASMARQRHTWMSRPMIPKRAQQSLLIGSPRRPPKRGRQTPSWIISTGQVPVGVAGPVGMVGVMGEEELGEIPSHASQREAIFRAKIISNKAATTILRDVEAAILLLKNCDVRAVLIA